MKKYQDLKALFETARNPSKGKPLPGRMGQTRLFKRAGAFAVLYMRTDVVTVSIKNVYTLNTDGYQTKTSKDRIHQYSPVRITSVCSTWLVEYCHGYYPYFDGMKVNEYGMPLNAGDPISWDRVKTDIINPYRREQRKLRTVRKLEQTARLMASEFRERAENRIVVPNGSNLSIMGLSGALSLSWPTFLKGGKP